MLQHEKSSQQRITIQLFEHLHNIFRALDQGAIYIHHHCMGGIAYQNHLLGNWLLSEQSCPSAIDRILKTGLVLCFQ